MKSVVFLIRKGRRGGGPRVAGPGRAGLGRAIQAGPGRAGTVWSSIWDPFWEAKLEVDLGAMFGGPNHLFSWSLSFRNRVHVQALNGLGMCLDCARVRFLAFKKMSPNEREKGE